jgi:hypothetical protein
MPVIVVAVVIRVLLESLIRISDAIGEAWRRLVRAYAAGYAMVPEGSKPGDLGGPERFMVSRDPISLPVWTGPGVIARVAGIRGVHASMRRHGWWWDANAGYVVELLPPWVVFGPNGRQVIDVIGAAATQSDERAAAITQTVDGTWVNGLLIGDPWRLALRQQIKVAVDVAIRQRIAVDVVPELALDPYLDVSPEQEAAFSAKRALWDGASAATVHAGLAAALVDELQPEAIGRLVADWQSLIDWQPDPKVETAGTLERAAKLGAGPLAFIEKYPSISIVLTMVLLLPLLAIAPYAALAAYGALLLITPAIVLRRRTKRRRRIRRRRWQPRGDVDGAAPSPTRLQRAITIAAESRTAIATNHLVTLLRTAQVWVAMEGPAPEDQPRTLRWLRSTQEPLPADLRRFGSDLVVLAFTDAKRHRTARIAPVVSWTAELDFGRVITLATAVGASRVAVDGGCSATASIPADGFDMFAVAETSPPPDDHLQVTND